jgi:predicted transposase YdaD
VVLYWQLKSSKRNASNSHRYKSKGGNLRNAKTETKQKGNQKGKQKGTQKGTQKGKQKGGRKTKTKRRNQEGCLEFCLSAFSTKTIARDELTGDKPVKHLSYEGGCEQIRKHRYNLSGS